MDRLFKSAVLRGMIGFVLGGLVSVGILCWASSEALGGDAGRLASHLLAGGLYGAAVMGATTLYDIERWSLARATLAHLSVALVGLYIVGLAQGWLTPSLLRLLVPTLAALALYFLIWIVQYLSYRRKIDQMNRGVKGLKGPRSQRRPSDGF